MVYCIETGIMVYYVYVFYLFYYAWYKGSVNFVLRVFLFQFFIGGCLTFGSKRSPPPRKALGGVTPPTPSMPTYACENSTAVLIAGAPPHPFMNIKNSSGHSTTHQSSFLPWYCMIRGSGWAVWPGQRLVRESPRGGRGRSHRTLEKAAELFDEKTVDEYKIINTSTNWANFRVFNILGQFCRKIIEKIQNYVNFFSISNYFT